MSLLKDIISTVAQEGEILHDFTVAKMKFVLKGLNAEEQILADSMIDPDYLNKKYGREDLKTYTDTMGKYRSICLVALAVKTIDGQSPVDESKSLKEQFEQRVELRNELMSLDGFLINAIVEEYNKLRDKQEDFFAKLKENLEK